MAKKKHDYKWYDLGPENPFNKRILDIRSFTWNTVATTNSKQIVETYNRQRMTLGQEYADAKFESLRRVECRLVFPHNGAKLEGIVFKSQSMDEKWDIYVYDDVFLFVRSWTGDLIYRVYVEILADKIIVNRIEHGTDEDTDLAINNVFFLLKTHAMGQVCPHKVPILASEEEIAIYSFQQFGSKACYACFDSILDYEVIGSMD